ncbi:MAG TPA: hypothetical protein VMY34_03330, partial [Acidimicrobiales bacterium]|nr:hypothetical protein [Acidimicrobiales bacterium]
LEKFEKYSRAFIKSKLPQFLAEYDKAAKSLKGLPEAQRGAFFIAGLNENLRTSGVEPIRLRSMTLDLKDLGGDIRVTLPDPAKDQTLMGDLSILQNRGEGAGRAVPEVVPGSNPTEGGSPPGEAPTIGEAPIGGAVPPGGETPAGGETPPEGATTTITEPPPVG